MRYLTFLLLWMVIVKHCKCDDMSDELLLDDVTSDDDISLPRQELFKFEDFTTRSISLSTLARSSTTPGPSSDFQTSPYDVLKKGPTNEPVIRVSSLEFEVYVFARNVYRDGHIFI